MPFIPTQVLHPAADQGCSGGRFPPAELPPVLAGLQERFYWARYLGGVKIVILASAHQTAPRRSTELHTTFEEGPCLETSFQRTSHRRLDSFQWISVCWRPGIGECNKSSVILSIGYRTNNRFVRERQQRPPRASNIQELNTRDQGSHCAHRTYTSL